ncbi:hypothetical protein CLV78_111108 [Aliiruegeria haliotis]|uniref:Uncharacterized protein n=1 Tax=Aliiruegeria haliotis TaxID=1280846 RepID=A0A2T0RIE3_9RHOB|nr:hypothetical protein CLV78_111108 [Aliiruegeria haliotis]
MNPDRFTPPGFTTHTPSTVEQAVGSKASAPGAVTGGTPTSKHLTVDFPEETAK